MRVKPEHVGHVISVRFYDHSLGSPADLIECEVIGRVVKVTQKQVVFEYWSILNEDKETEQNNAEQVAVAQSTIISIIEYSPRKGFRFY